jgi:hypothetical protein
MGFGGGIFLDDFARVPGSSLDFSMTHTTVARNQAIAGGGIWAGTDIRATATLIGGNRIGLANADDCDGPRRVISGGWTLLETPTGCRFVAGAGDLLGVRPLFGPLTPFGETSHVPLLKSSPGIDAVPLRAGLPPRGCATSVRTDQRDVVRPVGRGCDIGAVERTAGDP